MFSEDSRKFIQKRNKWNKWDLIVSLLILAFGIGFLIKSFFGDSKFDIALYGFICGSALCWFVNACITLKWLKILKEVKKDNKIEN
ncbi:MAG: hypothetical protein KAI43_08745 [Candidatus Aureabacteria bacterium]|nr:hypothetical protein [Candidatus Auribacterota bacterium]